MLHTNHQTTDTEAGRQRPHGSASWSILRARRPMRHSRKLRITFLTFSSHGCLVGSAQLSRKRPTLWERQRCWGTGIISPLRLQPS